MPELGRTVANAHLGNAFKNVIMVVIVNVPFSIMMMMMMMMMMIMIMMVMMMLMLCACKRQLKQSLVCCPWSCSRAKNPRGCSCQQDSHFRIHVHMCT